MLLSAQDQGYSTQDATGQVLQAKAAKRFGKLGVKDALAIAIVKSRTEAAKEARKWRKRSQQLEQQVHHLEAAVLQLRSHSGTAPATAAALQITPDVATPSTDQQAVVIQKMCLMHHSLSSHGLLTQDLAPCSLEIATAYIVLTVTSARLDEVQHAFLKTAADIIWDTFPHEACEPPKPCQQVCLQQLVMGLVSALSTCTAEACDPHPSQEDPQLRKDEHCNVPRAIAAADPTWRSRKDASPGSCFMSDEMHRGEVGDAGMSSVASMENEGHAAAIELLQSLLADQSTGPLVFQAASLELQNATARMGEHLDETGNVSKAKSQYHTAFMLLTIIRSCIARLPLWVHDQPGKAHSSFFVEAASDAVMAAYRGSKRAVQLYPLYAEHLSRTATALIACLEEIAVVTGADRSTDSSADFVPPQAELQQEHQAVRSMQFLQQALL